MKDPMTAAEWQEAVDVAHVLLCIHSARCYGLVTGGPQVNLDRCEHILKKGQRLGYRPAPDCVEKAFTPVEGPTVMDGGTHEHPRVAKEALGIRDPKERKGHSRRKTR